MPTIISFSNLTVLCCEWLNFRTPFPTTACDTQLGSAMKWKCSDSMTSLSKDMFFLLSCTIGKVDECIIQGWKYSPCYFSIPQVGPISLSHMTKLLQAFLTDEHFVLRKAYDFSSAGRTRKRQTNKFLYQVLIDVNTQQWACFPNLYSSSESHHVYFPVGILFYEGEEISHFHRNNHVDSKPNTKFEYSTSVDFLYTHHYLWTRSWIIKELITD